MVLFYSNLTHDVVQCGPPRPPLIFELADYTILRRLNQRHIISLFDTHTLHIVVSGALFTL